jgi:hypothetical protein
MRHRVAAWQLTKLRIADEVSHPLGMQQAIDIGAEGFEPCEQSWSRRSKLGTTMCSPEDMEKAAAALRTLDDLGLIITL